ncbi:MAG: hypothetical protein L6R40_000184 [Gallowayella cf. fulva]|nr:MAG: hypothetical protein L6R40_000184 [Xanthomendoza cf. fulva]
MTRYSHQGSLRSTGKVRLGPPAQYGSPANGSAGYATQTRDPSPHFRQATATELPKALRKEVSNLRERVVMARLELRERRVGMQQQHSLVRTLETQLLKHWQRLDGSPDQDAVARLHADLCTALDKLGPIEEDYDEREDGLDTLEYDLEAKETRFYRQITRLGPDGSDASSSTHRSLTSTPSDELDQDFLSPQSLYYSRIGDARIARERLMDLEAEKIQYLDIEREREALGIPLYQDNIDFLSQYDSAYAEHQKELEKIEKDIESLEVQAGFSSANDATAAVTFHELDWQSDLSAGNRQSSPFTAPGQARLSLLTVEEPPRRKSENDIKGVPNDSWSSRDRVNQWILERLKNSPIERARHQAILNDSKLDPEAWWSLVLEFWQLDRAACSSNNSSSHVSDTSLSAKAQGVHESLNLDLNEASIALRIAAQTPSVAYGVVETTYANADISRLNYLDLAARSLAKTKKVPRKWHSTLGC